MYGVIIAGLGLGLISNFHCIGMCGPLALAIPLSQHPIKRYAEIALYHIGRISTYAMLGVLVGMFSSKLAAFGWQQKISILCGVTLLVYVMLKLFKVKLFKSESSFLGKRISSSIVTLLHKTTLPSKFFLGFLNGLLPCGLVYIALASALAWGSMLQSILYMISFGIGTLPALVLVMLLKHKLSFSFRQHLNKSIPYFVGVLAIVLILRGMNLGIPYVSPKLNDKHSCCERVVRHP